MTPHPGPLLAGEGVVLEIFHFPFSCEEKGLGDEVNRQKKQPRRGATIITPACGRQAG